MRLTVHLTYRRSELQQHEPEVSPWFPDVCVAFQTPTVFIRSCHGCQALTYRMIGISRRQCMIVYACTVVSPRTVVIQTVVVTWYCDLTRQSMLSYPLPYLADGCEDFLPHASAPAGGSAVPNTVAGDFDSAAGLSGNGTGTPNSSAGPGTWSPQWGWYVTMTPPQVSHRFVFGPRLNHVDMVLVLQIS